MPHINTLAVLLNKIQVSVSVAVLALKNLAKPVDVWQGNKRLETSLCIAELFGARLRDRAEASQCSVRWGGGGKVSPRTFSTSLLPAHTIWHDGSSVLSEMWLCISRDSGKDWLA